MARELVIGIDLGTTSVKACVFQVDGILIAESEINNTFYYPSPGWSEQDAVEIERSTVKALSHVVQAANIKSGELLGVAFSAAMHSLVITDHEGKPLSPVMIWADGRSADLMDALSNEKKKEIYEKTGTPVHPMTPFSKLLWMNKTQYEPYLNGTYIMSVKEYILYQWFGERVIDYSMASATGLFNPSTRQWDQHLLNMVGVKQDQLSRIVAPTYILGTINPKIAQEVGINSHVPFVIGAADGQLSNLGIGAILPGEAAVTVGTSGAIRQFTDQFEVSDQQETFCYSFTKDTYIVGGPTNNGGIVLSWLKDLLAPHVSFSSFIEYADEVEPGANGLVFVPYLNGERAPIWNQRAKGSFYGLTITHSKEHMIRAALEGITFNLYQIGSALEKTVGKCEKIYVNGGLARSQLWLQLMANVFHAEIYVAESHHSAAWGAAWTGLVAVGRVRSFEDIKSNIPMKEPIMPQPEQVAIYEKLYTQYVKVASVTEILFS